MRPLSVAKAQVDSYLEHPPEASTQSAVKSSALPGLAALLKDFTAAVMKENRKPAVIIARNNSQAYVVGDNKDLYSFVYMVADLSRDAAVKSSAQAIMKYITENLVVANKTSPSLSNSHGIAIYIPIYRLEDESYADLDFSKDSNWAEFVRWQFGN
jgi:hypothetical protein